jgi:hypothetical protein
MHSIQFIDAILQAVAKHLPQLLPYAKSTIDSSFDLQFADFRLHSEEGAR